MLFLAGILVLVMATVHDDFMYRLAFSNYPLIGWGVVAFSLIQSYFISARFSQAFTRAETSEAEIRVMNRDLEKIIEEKTRDIRSIMEHIPLGVFMFDSKNYAVHKDYSVHSHKIFSRSKLQGMDATQLLFDKSQLTLDEKNQALCSIDSALDQELFNFETNSHCLPREIKRCDEHGRLATYELSWSAIENADDIIQRLLVTVRDVTDFRSLQQQAQEQNDILEVLAEILKVPVKRFADFQRDGMTCLTACQEALDAAEASDAEQLVQNLFVPIHTLKGTARSLHLRKATDIIHQVEQNLANQRGQGSKSFHRENVQADLKRLSDVLAFYTRVSEDILSRTTAPTSTVEWSADELHWFIQRLSKIEDQAPHPTLDLLIHRLRLKSFKPMKVVLESIAHCLPDLAHDLNKPVPKLFINAQDFRVSEAGELLLQNIFIHIFRNALDHGLEPSSERLKKGKIAQGSMDIEVVDGQEHVRIIVRDDGRGLAMERLRALARDRGLSESELVDDSEVASLIFQSGLSTAQQVTDISGRGVGMNAVLQYVEKNEGRVRVQLDKVKQHGAFANFSIEIDLPHALFLRDQADTLAIVA